MESTIEGEDENYVKVYITDNLDSEHELTIDKNSGDIPYHQCDAYADDANRRTSEENEYNNQARRYAKYYVFAQRGYDTVEHIENPAYVDAVRRAIADLSPAEFKRYFGALYRQLRSHHDDTERPRELPSGVRKPDAVVYEPEIYLGLEAVGEDVAERAQALATAHGFDLEESAEVQPVSELSDETLSRWKAFGDDLAAIVTREDLTTNLTITGVSGLHIGYPNRLGKHEVDEADSPFTHQADARLSLLPYAPESFDEFPAYLDHHLRCQVRDCFLKMGVVPPEEFHVVGFGKFRDSRRYDHFEMYPEVHKRDGNHTPLLG
ncbi:hypothetical protein [Halogeometricum borinquense]|uniref:Uncharacterized protein n=1 Tax=Halogeometricum borinquense (strain ATCC 700274 / DSM 11551 / JCM 10706 / KCTC 4070 / PR3) TaxID=469382 RepID=E4NSQ8_HALBP|nr:hypothetical protein [Halogeometricum borinquense]ADQ65796.1 hypothetical protein Hbor_01850 [Halogeometricum borinquense DSM 11551]